ncbi:hypothetical protein V5O48_005382 [Marasmius crinis-equi]|uniref:C2H2-type domain-containing protein n=1 Tax=Marasmius crinis-equi TaxID=585013 RepID=A0ABR3FMJ8_9AGAR
MFNFFRKNTSTTVEDPSPSNQQLRTPSPSATSAIGTRPQHMDRSSPLRENHGPPDTPSPPAHAIDNDLGLITDPSALYELISSVPPKILHEYTLTHLIPPSADSKRGTKLNVKQNPIHTPSSVTLTHLTSFFSSLTPPPRLHCVRCHKFYYDAENSDRSCLVAHDDESAEVERVGSGRGESGTQYETHWGCCEKTVEGDGDMGPPDGWCYEGKHTTDTKRARFRADSTIHDDKLTSCKRHKCFEPKKEVEEDDTSDASSDRRSRPRKRAAPTRKRARRADDDGEQEREQEEIAAAIPLPASPQPQVEVEEESISVTSKVQGKQPAAKKPRKKRARTTQDEKAFKPEGTPSGDEVDDMDVDDNASVTSKRKPRAKPKSKAVKKKTTTASDAGTMSPPKSVPASPTRSVRATPAKPRSSVGSARKTKKLEEVVASSVDAEM